MIQRSFLSASLLTTLLLAAVPGLNADSIPTFYATAVDANFGFSYVTATITGPGFSVSIYDDLGLGPALRCCYFPGAPLGSTLVDDLYASVDPAQYPPSVGQATIDLPGGPVYAVLSGDVDILVPPNSVLPYVPPTGGVGVIPAVAVGSFSACLPEISGIMQPVCDPNQPPVANIVVNLPGEYEIGAVPYALGFLWIDGEAFTAPTPEPSTALLFLAGSALSALYVRRRRNRKSPLVHA